MKNSLLIARRELGAYLSSMFGYVVFAAALLLNGLFFQVWAMGSQAKMSAEVLKDFFYVTSGLGATVALFLSMRLVAGEREHKTLVLLNTAPVTDREIIAGKFVGTLGLVALYLAMTIYMPLLIFVNGKLSGAQIFVGYVGALLFAAAALAIGIFSSALANNQFLALVIGAVITIAFVLLWLAAKISDPPLGGFLSGLSLHNERQFPFMTGVLRAENVVYYIGVTFFFLLAATKVLEARRWR